MPVAAAPRKPISRAPRTPPTRWTPTTSSASSKPNLNFSPVARQQTAPGPRRRMIEPTGVTQPQAGVIATRPATAPDAAPSVVGCPSRNFSVISQPIIAAAVAVLVVVNATAAVSLAARADPALNP